MIQGSVLLNNALLTSTKEAKVYECYNATSVPLYQISFHSDVVDSQYYKEWESKLPKGLVSKAEKLKKEATKPIALLFIEPKDDERHLQIYNEVDPTDWGKVIESIWSVDLANITEKVERDFNRSNKFITVLVNGGNWTGKSLFVKAMCNSLLTKISWKGSKSLTKHYSVVVLDIDVGQALYGMPCWIKAYEVLKPILSNYDIKISNEEKENSVLRNIK